MSVTLFSEVNLELHRSPGMAAADLTDGAHLLQFSKRTNDRLIIGIPLAALLDRRGL